MPEICFGTDLLAINSTPLRKLVPDIPNSALGDFYSRD